MGNRVLMSARLCPFNTLRRFLDFEHLVDTQRAWQTNSEGNKLANDGTTRDKEIR